MVQTLMVESFDNFRCVVSVGRDTIGLRADYVLKSELREFQAEYAGVEDGETAPDLRPDQRQAGRHAPPQH